MPEKKTRFVLVCRQVLACGTVAALAAPAVGVVSLDIVGPPDRHAGGSAHVAAPVALVASHPVHPDVREVPLKGVESTGLQALTRRAEAQSNKDSRLAVLSAPEKVTGFATVGVTWNHSVHLGDDDVTVSVRSLDSGSWSAWEPIEYHDDHGPDPGSEEAAKARQGTDPIVVGDVDQVQVKVETADGKVPAGAELALIDPKDTPAPMLETPAIDTADLPEGGAVTLSSSTTGATPVGSGTGTTTGTTTTGTTTTDDGSTDTTTEPTTDDGVLTAVTGVTPKPQIFSRAQWGADERMRDRSSLHYYEVHAGFVHHTVNANGYTRAQVPSLLRGIYAYHTQSKGWSDIGYNFVVDRFGRIWEGRYGGVDRPVVGAHTLNYNEYSFAMSALGNFETGRPSAKMLDAYGRLFAWKLSLHGVSASSTKQWVGSKYFQAINGHRDAGQTACPGRYLYAKIPTIRALAAKYQAPFTERSRAANLAGSNWPDLAVRDKATKKLFLLRTGGQTNFKARHRVQTRWKGMDLLVPAPDLTSDGVPDMMARDSSSGVTAVYPGTPTGALGGALKSTTRFSRLDTMVATPSVTLDGKADLVGRTDGGTHLWLYAGKGDGGFRKRRVLRRDWTYGLTAAAGDLNEDGHNDLLARSGRELLMFPGKGWGVTDPVKLPGTWSQYSEISGAGDLTNDGHADLMVRVRRNGLVFVFPGDGEGHFGHRIGPFRQFRHLDYLAAVPSFTGAAGGDLLGRAGNGDLFVYPNNGGRNVEGFMDTGISMPGANLILNVGDWNGDGYGDIMNRTPKGTMLLRTGNGRGGFDNPVRAATNWGKVRLVAAVGDITGDGHPDLMGQPDGSAMRIYPGDGAAGFKPSYVAHSAISSDRHTGLGLWDGDGSPDSLVRRSDGTLALYPGNGPGGLMTPRQIGKGTKQYDWLQSVGDATGNHRPDLIARERRTGKLWLLPGTRKGFAPRRLVAPGYGGYDLSS